MKKRGIWLATVIILLSLLSSIALFNKPTITGLQVGGVGCCILSDRCEPSDDQPVCDSIGGIFNSQSCGEVTQCQPGCCACINTQSGQAIKAEIVQYQIACNLNNLDTCKIPGATDAVFDPALTESECASLVAETASISGVIRNKANSDPISNAAITLSGPVELSTSSDNNGNYQFIDLPPLTIDITASAPGFLDNFSTLILSPGEAKGFDILLAPGGEVGRIRGTITDQGGQPLAGVTVTISQTFAQRTTGADGRYSFDNLDISLIYQITASKIPEYTSKTSDPVSLSSITPEKIVDLTITERSVGELRVGVRDSQGTLAGAKIKVDGEERGQTASNGKTTITLDTGQHTICAEAPGHKRKCKDTLILEDRLEELTLILPFGDPSCQDPNKPPVPSFTVSHIPGVKAVSLEWKSACADLAGYTITRTGDSARTVFLPVALDGTQILSFVDFDVEWESTYSYIITASYAFPQRESISTGPETITLGNQLCEERFVPSLQKFSEFCISTYNRSTCNEQNQIIPASENRGGRFIPYNCNELNTQEGQHFVCAGPDISGLTDCRDQGACFVLIQQAGPFGLYYSKQNCYGTGQETPNYCYYDFSPTVVDACYPCSQDLTCFDYNSPTACLDDHCEISGLSSCRWFPSGNEEFEYAELGKGFCYSLEYEGTDQCSKCSQQSPVFQNAKCTQELCTKLGACYADKTESSCFSCVSCELLTTQDQCNGGQNFALTPNPPSDQCNTNIIPSNDVCGFEKCRWDTQTNKCFKDGNEDGQKDCTGIDNPCTDDVKHPTTQPQQTQLLVTSNQGITFTSDQDAQELVYCIDSENTCCPDQTTTYLDSGRITVQPEDLRNAFPEMSDGEYFIRFYSIDEHFNQEPVQSASFIADVVGPKITVTPVIKEGNCMEDSNITFDITTNQEAVCTDSLQGPDSTTRWRLSDAQGMSFTPSYLVADGEYTYTVSCSDEVDNANTTILDIATDVCKLIIITNPIGPVKETEITFEIETLNPSECFLLAYDSQAGNFIADQGSAVHTTTTAVGANQNFTFFAVNCTNKINRSQTDKAWFSFSTDFTPPTSGFTLTAPNLQFNTTDNNWKVFIGKPEDISEASFTCEDEALLHNFGCNEQDVQWCIVQENEQTCIPQFQNLDIQDELEFRGETTKICYQAADMGGNQESLKCGTVYIGEGIGITLVNPPYNVSNVNPFDAVIETQTPTSLCKFQANGFPNSFASQINQLNFFTPVTDKQHKIPGFTKAAPDFNMYIKCKDSNGFINENQPSNFLLEYDSTPPVIRQAYADPNPVLQDNFAMLIAETDDKTICKYSTTTSNYEFMEYAFDGWQEWGLPNKPNFNVVNTKKHILSPVGERTVHNFFVSCQNRAGDITESPKEITLVVDYSQSGFIRETSPSGSTLNTTVTLEVITSKNANCQFQEDGNMKPFDQTGGTVHNTVKTNLVEQEYFYPITCSFFDPSVIRTGEIRFIVDLTEPVLTNVNDGRFSCGNFIFPQFEVEDISPMKFFNYSLYDKNTDLPVQNWTTATSTSPSIMLPSRIEEGDSLYFVVVPVDAAGNIGKPASSDGFIVQNASSGECRNDTIPPLVTVEKETTHQGIKTFLKCEDNTGCGSIYYGKEAPENSCNATITYTGPVFIKETSNFCWRAFDIIGNMAVGTELILVDDEDGDGVPDDADTCPGTPAGELVDSTGCSQSQLQRDTDKDGVPDRADICPDTLEGEEVDEDGCSCSQKDTDQDGLTDCDDKCPGTPLAELPDTNGCADSQKDSDSDGMDDAWEKRHGFDPFDPSNADLDPDGDRMTNFEEYLYFKQTGKEIDPHNADTDGDGFSDKVEIDRGTDPTDSKSKPRGKALSITFMIVGFLLLIAGAAYTIYMKITTEKPIIQPTPYSPRVSPEMIARRREEERRKRIRAEEIEKKKEEVVTKRRETKYKKRKKFFDIFGKERAVKPKKKVTPGKLEPFAESTKTPEEEDIFKKLAGLTEEQITGKKSIGHLLKITKVPPKKKEEFQRLTKLIEEKLKVSKIKRPKELTLKQKKEIQDIFADLEELTRKGKKIQPPKLKKQGETAKQPFKKLKKLTSKRKTAKKPFKKLKKVTRKKVKKPFKQIKKLTKKKR